MQIQCITPVKTKPYNTPNKYQTNTLMFKAGIVRDTYVKKQLPFDKLKNFTIAEYRQLSKAEINDINKMIDDSFWILHDKVKFFDYLKYHDLAATSIKDTLESKYGAENFVVIPIGRSLSSIGKCLGYKIGEDNVKPLPMSGTSRFIDMESAHCQKENYDVLNRYLDSVGLSKEDVKASGKKYIFTDFCHTGASLCGAEKLFKSQKVYGDFDNLEFINVHNLLLNTEPKDIQEKLETEFFRCTFKDYSLVDQCRNLFNTKNAVIKPQNYSKEAKYFYFKLLDNEMKKRL